MCECKRISLRFRFTLPLCFRWPKFSKYSVLPFSFVLGFRFFAVRSWEIVLESKHFLWCNSHGWRFCGMTLHSYFHFILWFHWNIPWVTIWVIQFQKSPKMHFRSYFSHKGRKWVTLFSSTISHSVFFCFVFRLCFQSFSESFTNCQSKIHRICSETSNRNSFLNKVKNRK